MGSLSNLYISQSYQSLIHLATNNTASATLIGLEDGLGNSIGVSVNTAGNLYLSGTFSASLQEGYIYVGNSSGRTIAFPTSSFINELETGSLLTTASFNSYTASTNIRLSNIEIATASILVSISNLNASSASQQVSINALNSYTQSNDQKWNNLAAQSGSWITESETGSFARWDVSNPWSANQTFTNITAVSASFTYVQTVFETSSVIYSSGSNQFGDELTDIQTLSGSVKIRGGLLINSLDVTASINSLTSKTGSYATTGSNTFIGNQIITHSGGASFTLLDDSGIAVNYGQTAVGNFEISQSGSVIMRGNNGVNFDIFGSASFVSAPSIPKINSNVTIDGSLTASLQQGYAWVGDISNISKAIPTSSFASLIDTGSFATTSSFNAYTASNDQRVSSLESNSASVNISISNLNTFTASISTASIVNSITNLNQFTQSANQRLGSLEGATGSYVTETESGSFLITASFASQTLTFTKGDGTQFGVLIPDVSGSTIDTGSFLITASVNVDDITFTKGDGSQFTIQVATGSYAETASLALNAKDIIVDVKNMTGTQIDKGTVVRIIGSVAASDVALIGTASWENDGSSANTLGFVTADIPHDSFGTVMTQGTLLGIDTDGFTAGQILYLSSSGQYTNVIPPAPYHEVRLGQVLRVQQNNGSMYVLIQNGYELGELHDVDITTGSLANNQVLAYDSASGQWENKTLTEVGAVLTSSFNAYTQSANQRLTAIETVSGSWITESESGSFLITGSVAGNVLTFTKGDNTTFNLTVATGSGGGGSTDTGSLLVTASFNTSTRNITFTKGDASTFNLGGFATTGSNTFTDGQAIFANNAITISGSNGFGYGITLQGAQGIKLEGSGGPRIQFPNSTWFNGNENEDLIFTADTDNPLTRGLDFFLYGSGSQKIRFRNNSGPGATIVFSNQSGSISLTAGSTISITGSSLQLQGLTYPNADGTNGQVLTTNGAGTLSFTTVSGGANTGSLLVTASVNLNTITFTKGDASTFNITVDTGSGGGTTYINPTLNPYSGSLILAANTTSTASLGTYITASNNGQVNLMFLNRNLTGGVYVSGSSNIFPNPNTPTAGRLNYLGGSSNILLTSFTANNTQAFPSMTGSTATIGGIYPAMNGNILMGQSGWTINTSNNPGIHNYNNNILNGVTTFNMLGNVQVAGVANSGRFDFTGNTSAGTFLINSPSRSVAEINAGATGSLRLSITNNNVQGTLTYNGPVSGSATTNIHSITQNIVAGTVTMNVQSGSKGYTVSGNSINGVLVINDNTAFTPTLGSNVNYANNIINGSTTFNTRNSGSFGVTNNNINTWTISSDADVSTITSANRLTTLNGNILGGVIGNNILYSGSTSTANARKQITSNIMAGNLISASVGGDEQALLATAVLGHGLTVFGTGICNLNNLSVGGERQGSLFAGRWNSLDGTRGFTAETIFAVGTGNSGSAGITRKTGFLIDSGSNTFIEGTLNVSGSTTITGSLTLSSSAAIELDVVGNSQFTGSLTVSGSTTVTGSVNISNVIQLAQLDPLPVGATGQLAVSQSLLWFYDATQWKQVSLV